MAGHTRLTATLLTTSRIALTPLEVADAVAMAEVLSDPALYLITGGSPPSVAELETRYRRQVEGPWPEGEAWLNWVVRLRAGEPVGYVQATVIGDEADLAWVIGTDHQRRGYAGEAARAVAAWLVGQGVPVLTAHIAPGHIGSERVAVEVGMASSGEYDDEGERIWRLEANGKD